MFLENFIKFKNFSIRFSILKEKLALFDVFLLLKFILSVKTCPLSLYALNAPGCKKCIIVVHTSVLVHYNSVK